MNIQLILLSLFLSTLFLSTCADDTLVFGITPNDPMVYCHLGDEFTGLELISDTIAEQVRGYDIDLLKFLAYRNNWNLTKWKVICLDYDTLLDKIKNQDIIMGLGGIPITALRLSEGYEFSLPVYSSGLKIVSRTWSENQIWSFFDSFETSLWVVILFTTLFTGIVTWILEDQNFQWGKNKQRVITNLKEMIWQTFSGLFYTSEIRLQKFPARIVWLCFWFMILILTATYTADLSTKMSIKTPQLKYTNLQEAGIMGMNIATLEPYKKMVSSYGVQKLVVKEWSETSLSQIEDIFLTEVDGVVIDAPAALKLNSKFPCSSSVLADSLSSFNYGYIFWKGVENTFIQSIDAALLEIKESREYQAILKQNIYVAPEDVACQDTFQKLTFSKLGGLWIIFAGAVLIAAIIDRVNAYFERKRGAKKALTSKRVDEMNADEKKFVLDSYLMISDYIHIPTSDLHLRLEDDIKNALDNVEQTLKDRFNNIEKKILDILNSSKAHGILDASTSEIQSQIDQQQPQRFEFNFEKKTQARIKFVI